MYSGHLFSSFWQADGRDVYVTILKLLLIQFPRLGLSEQYELDLRAKDKCWLNEDSLLR